MIASIIAFARDAVLALLHAMFTSNSLPNNTLAQINAKIITRTTVI